MLTKLWGKTSLYQMIFINCITTFKKYIKIIYFLEYLFVFKEQSCIIIIIFQLNNSMAFSAVNILLPPYNIFLFIVFA